jgi:hypothetical protein
MKMAAMKLGNTPRPAAWSPLASFPPPVLILAMSSSNSLPHLAVAAFRWMDVSRMIACGGRRRRKLLIGRGATRSKGRSNRHKNPLGRSDQADRPRPFLGWFGSIFLPAAHLHILHLAPFICVILRSSFLRSR